MHRPAKAKLDQAPETPETRLCVKFPASWMRRRTTWAPHLVLEAGSATLVGSRALFGFIGGQTWSHYKHLCGKEAMDLQNLFYQRRPDLATWMFLALSQKCSFTSPETSMRWLALLEMEREESKSPTTSHAAEHRECEQPISMTLSSSEYRPSISGHHFSLWMEQILCADDQSRHNRSDIGASISIFNPCQ